MGQIQTDDDSDKPGSERRAGWRPPPRPQGAPAKGVDLTASAVAAAAQPPTQGAATAVAEAPQPVSVEPGDRVALGADLAPDLPRDEAGARTRNWWLGTLPSCPVSVVHLGGQNFPEYENPPFDDAGNPLARRYRLGRVAALTDAQVGKIRDAIKRRVVRLGANGGVYQIPIPGQQARRGNLYRPMPGDEPLAKHVFMVPQDYCGERLPDAAYYTGIPLGT